MQNSNIESHLRHCTYLGSVLVALRPRFGLVLGPQVEGFASRRSFWADFAIFEILGGAGDINNSTSMANYCNGPYIRLLPCANKVFSAWTEVWLGSCRSSERFWFPEVGDLDRFFEIFEILGEAGDINNSISVHNY